TGAGATGGPSASGAVLRGSGGSFMGPRGRSPALPPRRPMIADRRTRCQESLATSTGPHRPDPGSHGGSPGPATGRIHPHFQQDGSSNLLPRRDRERRRRATDEANSPRPATTPGPPTPPPPDA